MRSVRKTVTILAIATAAVLAGGGAAVAATGADATGSAVKPPPPAKCDFKPIPGKPIPGKPVPGKPGQPPKDAKPGTVHTQKGEIEFRFEAGKDGVVTTKPDTVAAKPAKPAEAPRLTKVVEAKPTKGGGGGVICCVKKEGKNGQPDEIYCEAPDHGGKPGQIDVEVPAGAKPQVTVEELPTATK